MAIVYSIDDMKSRKYGERYLEPAKRSREILCIMYDGHPLGDDIVNSWLFCASIVHDYRTSWDDFPPFDRWFLEQLEIDAVELLNFVAQYILRAADELSDIDEWEQKVGFFLVNSFAIKRSVAEGNEFSGSEIISLEKKID